MSGWAQRDAENNEIIKEINENRLRCLDAVDDFLICNWVVMPTEDTPEAYRQALHELCCDEQKLAVYFEHQRLIKLNEDFYGPAFREEAEPTL